MQRLLMWASVSDPNIFARCGRHEQMLRSISGALILLTGAFAFASATWALYFVFSELYICVIVALLWSFLIVCIDRSIVGSLKLKPNSDTSRLRYRISPFFPRFVLAIAIALVISTPIELFIFRVQISETLERIAIRDAEEDAKASLAFNEDRCKSRHSSDRKLAEENFLRWDRLVNESNEGRDESGRNGCERICQGRMKNRDEARRALTDIEQRIAICIARNAEGTGAETTARQKEDLIEWSERRKQRLKTRPSLVDQYIQLNNYLVDHGFAKIMAYALRFLFVLIEVIPILTKLLSGPGMYDQLLAAEQIVLDSKTKSKILEEEQHSQSFEHGRKVLSELIRRDLKDTFEQSMTQLSKPPLDSDTPLVVFAKAIYVECLSFARRVGHWGPVFDGQFHSKYDYSPPRQSGSTDPIGRDESAASAERPSGPASEAQREPQDDLMSDALKSGRASLKKRMAEQIDKVVETLIAPIGGGIGFACRYVWRHSASNHDRHRNCNGGYLAVSCLLVSGSKIWQNSRLDGLIEKMLQQSNHEIYQLLAGSFHSCACFHFGYGIHFSI